MVEAEEAAETQRTDNCAAIAAPKLIHLSRQLDCSVLQPENGQLGGFVYLDGH